MSRVLLVTGTDTGIGKTVATAALASAARQGALPVAGLDRPASVAVMKPAQTGVGPDEPGDLDEIQRLTGLTRLHEGVRLRDPLAPTTAARRQGIPIPSVEAHAKVVDDLAATHDLVLVEGAGGLLVGLDEAGRTLADLASHLRTRYSFIVVTRPALGTLNHTLLTTEALRARGHHIEGLVLGAWPAVPGLAETCNLQDLPVLTGLPVLGRLPEDVGSWNQKDFTEAAASWFGAH